MRPRSSLLDHQMYLRTSLSRGNDQFKASKCLACFRFSIDLGLPVVSVDQMLKNVSKYAGKTEEFNHKFFHRVKEMVDAGDEQTIHNEKIPLKLLQLNPACNDGFILTDFPRDVAEAEQLEEFRGGLNAYVHLTLPLDVLFDIERVRIQCEDCNRNYYTEDIINEEHGVRIEKFVPRDNVCDDCGSSSFVQPNTSAQEAALFSQ